MQDRTRFFKAYCLAFLILAIFLTVFLWLNTTPVKAPLAQVLLFGVFATATILLAVTVSENEGSFLTPTAAVSWAAPCIFGPVIAAVVCAGSAILGDILMNLAFYLGHALRSRLPDEDQSSCGRLRRMLLKPLTDLSGRWQGRELWSRVQTTILFSSTLAVSMALSGTVYRALGGRFLIEHTHQVNWLFQFILPFIGLVIVSILVEHGEYLIGMAVIYPVPGASGWYGFILRIKLAFIEDVLPVWRGELFLVVVSILMAFLYARIGFLGLALAIMPVIALRDFYGQWVKTKQAYLDTITTLATYMQHYHPYTRGHLKRVAEMSERLARELRLPADSIRHMNTAGFLHDIGKIAVSEEILDKTGKLTDDEWARIKEHPVKGAEIISHLEFLEGIVDWIKYHHKWYNGMGYPGNGNGNGNGRAPIEAAIIAAADAFDAMTDDRELSLEWHCDTCGYRPSDDERPEKCPKCGAEKRRTYREPKTLDQAIDELRRGAGSQFDPRVVKAFLTMVEREGIHLNA
jgi:putative nucleotidyltransferase with HDIG domain